MAQDKEWFNSKAQFPLIDAKNGERFGAGIPTLAVRTSCVEQQIAAGALEQMDAPANTEVPAKDTLPVSDEQPPAGDGSKLGGKGS